MSNISESQMNAWVKMVNEERYSFNPDQDKQDKLDMQGDKYEELKKDLENYYSDVEKTGKIEGNLKESDGEELPLGAEDEEKKTDETSTSEEPEKKETSEAMSVDDILKKFDQENKKLAEQQAKVAEMVKRVDIEELYDGYVKCTVTFNDGHTKEMEFEISEDELQDMFKQIEKKAAEKKVNVTLDDAAIAVIRRRIDPADKLDWFYAPTKTSLDEWFLEQDVNNENEFTNYQKSSGNWEEVVGLITDDEGETIDRTGDNFADYDDNGGVGSTIGGDDQMDSYQRMMSRRGL